MEADPDYIKRLEDLPDHLRRAYLHGDWNIFSGLAFTELNKRVHVVKPFTLPANTKYFGGYDWGYRHPFSFILCGITMDKDIYVISYRVAQGKLPPEHAREIKKIVGNKKIKIMTAPDAFSQKGGEKIINQLRGAAPQLTWVRANDDRVQGVQTLRKLFAYEGTESGKPQLHFFENTLPVYDQVASMMYNDRKPEDVIKMDADEFGYGGDDLYDALRYALHTYLYPNKRSKKKPDVTSGQYILNRIKEEERIERASRLMF